MTPISRRGLIGAALAATASAGIAPAAAIAASRPWPGHGRPRGLPETIHAYADTLYPEGVVWDDTRQAFLVSSSHRATVSIVDGAGKVTPLIADPDPRMVSTIGMRPDPSRNRLLVSYFDLGEGIRSTPDSFLKVSGLGSFDLATGEQHFLVDLSIGSEGYHAADRMVLDHHGNVYVCDPAANKIYRVSPEGEAVTVVDHTVLAPGVELGLGAGTTGLALHPAGFLLAMNYSEGTLVRVPLNDPGRSTPVRLPSPLYGGDGIALLPDGTLIVVTNALSTPNGADAVTLLRPLDPFWSAARFVRQVAPWPVPAPTDVAVTPYGNYVLSGRADLLNEGVTANDFILRRL